jgi:hypothetical protein
MEGAMKPRSHDVIQRMIPPLAVWVVGKVLEVPRVQRALHRVDRQFEAKKRKAERHATHHRAWFAAGAAAFVLGIGCMARATKR